MSYQPPPPPMGQWRPTPPPLAPNGQPLATFLDRFLAYLVDSMVMAGVILVIYVPLMIIFMVVVVGEGMTAQENGVDPNPWVFIGAYFVLIAVTIVVGMLVTYLYYVEYQLRQNGQTVGKKVMKLWVIPVGAGDALTRSHLLKRWSVQSVVAQFLPGFSLLDGLWQLWDKPLQQCLHDKAAQTVVVKLG